MSDVRGQRAEVWPVSDCSGWAKPCNLHNLMANSATISRAQLTYGLCLPLAALIGFFLAEPLQSSSLIVLGVLLTILVWPLFARWHHPLLVGSLHSIFVLAFLPGALPLWVPVACGGFLIVIFRRSLDHEIELFPPGGVAWALVALGMVVVVTAWARGGVGLRSLGSESIGGKKYLLVLASIFAYFVLVSHSVPHKRALAYMGIFYLSGLTSVFSHLVYFAGSKFYWLFNIIDSSGAAQQAAADWDVQGNALMRSGAPAAVASAIIGFMLARHGLLEMFDLRKPWRPLLLLACLGGGLLGGFRSFVVEVGLIFVVFFLLEGLHRTGYLAVVVLLGLLGFGALAAFSNRLPVSVQRSISFLPVQVDARVRQDAQGSLDWRFEMWKELVRRDVPKYALVGKGYAIDPSLLGMAGFNESLGYGLRSEWAMLGGEYHNGPLSVVIPFGIWGAMAFGWFLIAGVLRFRWFCRHGDPRLINMNRMLYALFVSKIVFFIFLFGALHVEMVEFAVLAGLAECLNTGQRASEDGLVSESLGEADKLGELEST